MNDNEKKIIPIIVGPTGVGKTELSIKLAKELSGEIISADSMQVYKMMDIGTAKITEAEKEGITHHLLDIVYPDQKFSVSDFNSLANQKIDEILASKKLPIIVGGTGLYVSSLINGYDFSEDLKLMNINLDEEEYQKNVSNFRKSIQNKLKSGEITKEELYEKAMKIDPEETLKNEINNTKKIVRILEIYETTGKTKTEIDKIRSLNKSEPNGYIYDTDKYSFIVFEINLSREKLYERINLRIDKMLAQGLVKEVKEVLNYLKEKDSLDYVNTTSIQAIGYKEVVKYLNGEIDYDETVRILKRDSRRYAKRQMTYFRKINTINLDKSLSNEDMIKIIKMNILI